MKDIRPFLVCLLTWMLIGGSASADHAPPFWMRQEGYQAAVDAALAQSDVVREDPSLIGRDFTHQTNVASSDHGLELTYAPCAFAPAEILNHIGLAGLDCTAFPGVGGVKHGNECPQDSCVIVSIRTETWADPISQRIILSTVANHQKVCALVAKYGPNKRADFAAVGCDTAAYERPKIAIEVKPRLTHPCINVLSGQSRAKLKIYRPICSNPSAVIHFAGRPPGA